MLDRTIPKLTYRTSCAEKNDKLGWSAGFTLQMANFKLGIRTNEPAELPIIREFLPLGPHEIESTEVEALLSLRIGKPSGRKGVQHYHLVYDGWDRVQRTLDRKAALEFFQYCVIVYYIKSLNHWACRGIAFSDGTTATAVIGPPEALTAARTHYCKTHSVLSDKFVICTAKGNALPYKGSDRAGPPEGVPVQELLIVSDEGPRQTSPGETAVRIYERSFGLSPQSRLLAISEMTRNCTARTGPLSSLLPERA